MRHRIVVAAITALLATPFGLFAQCPEGTPPPCAAPRAARGAAPAPTSIAVLAFENLSRDTADLYLIDGISEELTGRLGSVTRLRVTGRSVTRRAQQAAGGDAMAIGRALNVRYLVEGSLRRSATRVRVSARLVRASDGVMVWSDDYNRTLDDLLALQEDIARHVALGVAGQLLPGERTALAARPTTVPAAYDHYLRGNYLSVRRTSASITQAAAELEEAVRLDPRFAAAEARRASVYVLAFGYGVPIAPEESLAVWAQRSASRALRLDSSAADSWLAVAAVRFWFPPWDIDAARAAAERAIGLDSASAEAHHFLGVIAVTVAEWLPTAALAFQRALAIDPTRAVSLLDLAETRSYQGRDNEARALVDSAIALEPLQARNYGMRSGLRRRAGDVAGAGADAQTGLRLSGPHRIRLASLAQAIEFDVRAGDTATARGRLAEIEGAPTRWAIAHALALAHLGMPDSAVAVLRRGPLYPVDWGTLPLPAWDALRAVPGYERAVAPWRPRRSGT